MKIKWLVAIAMLGSLGIVGDWGWSAETPKTTSPEPGPAVPKAVPPRSESPRAPAAPTGVPEKLRIGEDEPARPIQAVPRVRVETTDPVWSGIGSPRVEKSEVSASGGQQSVAAEWVMPPQVKVAQSCVYELLVRNNGTDPVSGVSVETQFPTWLKVVSVAPASAAQPTTSPLVIAAKAVSYRFAIGDLKPREERRFQFTMIAEKKGEVTCQATVRAESKTSASFRVREPKLVIKQVSPEKVMVGNPMTLSIEVSNPGDGSADRVVIQSLLSDGLTHEKGAQFSYELGALAAGETRTLQVVCTAVKGGNQSVRTVARADGLEANAQSTTQVSEPKLNVAVEGPKLRYLERAATYRIVVGNPGDAPANNVKVVANIPTGFEYVQATEGGIHDDATRTIAWFVGTLPTGSEKEVSYKAVAVQAGEHKHMASAVAQRGLKASAESVTDVKGISALLLEVVDIDDPVEVGADTAYEVRVTNQGSQEATNVEIHARVPEEMKLRGGQGPTKYRVEGQEIIFAPLPKLAPRADAIYRILVRGAGVGDLRFRARLISDSLSEPVIEEESTKVYSD